MGARGIDAENLSAQAAGVSVTSSALVKGKSKGITTFNFGKGAIEITAKGAVEGTEDIGIGATNAANSDLGVAIRAEEAVFGGNSGIVVSNKGKGSVEITALKTVDGLVLNGIEAKNSAASSGDVTVRAKAMVQGGERGILLDDSGAGKTELEVHGDVVGGTVAGIVNVDGTKKGAKILVAETGSVGATSGVAIRDGDGGSLVRSWGALKDNLEMNGGEDRVDLLAGSATGLIDLGEGDDGVMIAGAGVGGGWDDADLNGVFDNNLGQQLAFAGGGGFDFVQLMGVTADSGALGTATGMDALVLSDASFLQANNADLTSFGTLFIGPQSIVQAFGNSPSDTIVGPTGSVGLINLQDGEANDRFTVDGDYAGGTGSELWLDANFNGAGSSDTFIINGSVRDVGAGPFMVEHDQTLVNVNYQFGDVGMVTGNDSGDGIRLIDVSATGNTDEDDFVLANGPLEVGAFYYGLNLEGDGIWYLQSESLRDQGVINPYIPYSLKTFGRQVTGTYYERTGTRIGWRPDLLGTSTFGSSADLLVEPVIVEEVVEEASTRFGAWARILGAWSDADGTLAGGFNDVSYDETLWAVQAGFDGIVSEGDNGTLVASAFLHYGQIDTDSDNTLTGLSAGSTDTDGWGGGIGLTYATTGGLYLDGVATYTRYDMDVTAATGDTGNTDANGWTLSGEAGWRIAVADQVAVTPQAQLIYQGISIDGTTDSAGLTTSFSDADSLEGRIGTTLEFVPMSGDTTARLYVEANLVQEFLDDPVATVAGTPLALGFDDTGYEVGLGAEFGQNGGGFAAWVEGDYRAPFNNNGIDTWSATGGVAFRF